MINKRGISMNLETARQKAKELVKQMTVDEKVSQLTYHSKSIERLGIKSYNWWNEALHGVARAGTATVFPQAIALAAMFDEELIKKTAEIIAEEARARYNELTKQEDRGIYKGLTFWSPNVNIFRDPRWGRGHETYGEDPYLTSRLGVAFIEGLQGDGEYLKTAACAKHFAVHSGPESLRHEFNAEVSQKDLYETYLPAFEACVKEGKVAGIMGAYNRTNGEPCCGSKTLLKDILRESWQFEGYIVSDCWAIRDFHEHHGVTETAEESAALALHNGCDLNCGSIYAYLLRAYEEGMVTEDEISLAVEHLLTIRVMLGMFDNNCEYDSIPFEKNDCIEHKKFNLEVAQKSMVLLKNNGILPLDKKKLNSIAVIGPNADSTAILRANYFGTSSENITILKGIQEAAGEDIRVYYAQGCHLYKEKTESLAQADDRIAEAVIAANHSDVVILCLGLDATIEGEQGDTGNSQAGGDKLNLDLPNCQQKLLEAVIETGKPVIVVLATGSALAVNYADEKAAAILNVWYPGAQGGRAAADIIFGKVSPSGKLPVTFYKTVEELPEFTDYSMKNRTYRYMENESLYSFGYGLTYSKVELNLVSEDKIIIDKNSINADLTAEIKNIGKYDCEEVLQVYIKDEKSTYSPLNCSLCSFKRVSLKKGETKQVKFTLTQKDFCIVDDDGVRRIDGDTFSIYIGISAPDKRSEELTRVKALKIELTLK